MSVVGPFEDRAKNSGLTQELVRLVVVKFYDQVKRDDVLGPIFTDAIGEKWDRHIELITEFWLTSTRLDRRNYDGKNFIPAHLKHHSIRVDLLPRWLQLFRHTTSTHCTPEGAAALIDIAERMAETLSISLARRDGTRNF